MPHRVLICPQHFLIFPRYERKCHENYIDFKVLNTIYTAERKKSFNEKRKKN